MNRWSLQTLLAALAVLLATAPARAAQPRDTYSVIFENDLFYHTDRDYTNGIEFAYSPAGNPRDAVPGFLLDLAPDEFSGPGTRTSFSLGQMMFTPEDTAAYDPPLTQRPYAGFLYGGLMLSARTATREDQLRLQLGVTGPASLAADAQDFVHRLRGFALPQGWHTQLRDEPGLVLSYQRIDRIAALSSGSEQIFDLNTNYGGAIGNIFDYADAGFTARLGFNMPADNGPPQIEPARPGSYFYLPQPGLGAYIFAGLQGRAVARNIFLDGNSFQPSRSVDKENFVGELAMGGALTYDRFRLSFVHVIRTREYKLQSGFDQFGTLCLSVNL